jgi:hypothetical protein
VIPVLAGRGRDPVAYVGGSTTDSDYVEIQANVTCARSTIRASRPIRSWGEK